MRFSAALFFSLAVVACADAPSTDDTLTAFDCGGELPLSAHLLDEALFQHQSNWCWAAVGTMAAQTQGIDVRDQCEAVSIVYNDQLGEGATDQTCCAQDHGVMPDCDQGGFPALIARDLYDLDFESHKGLATPDFLRRALANGHMPALGLDVPEKAHVMAVTGYDGLGPEGTFTLDDPLHGRLDLTYDELPLGFHETYKQWTVRETLLFGTKTRVHAPDAC